MQAKIPGHYKVSLVVVGTVVGTLAVNLQIQDHLRTNTRCLPG